MQVWPTLTMAALGAVLEVLDPRLASSRTHRPVVGIGEGEGQIHSNNGNSMLAAYYTTTTTVV